MHEGGQGLAPGYPAGRPPSLDELQPDVHAVQHRDRISQRAELGKAEANLVSGIGAAGKDAVLDDQGQIVGGTDPLEHLCDHVGGHSSGLASEEGYGLADDDYDAQVPNIGPLTKIAGSLAKTGEHVPRELGQKTTDYDVLSFTTGFLEQGVGLGLAKFHPAGRPPLAEKDSPPEIQKGVRA